MGLTWLKVLSKESIRTTDFKEPDDSKLPTKVQDFFNLFFGLSWVVGQEYPRIPDTERQASFDAVEVDRQSSVRKTTNWQLIGCFCEPGILQPLLLCPGSGGVQ